MNALLLTSDKGVVQITISIGGVAFSGHNLSLEYHLNQADQALYEAKSTGRNRTILVDDLTILEKKGEKMQTGFFHLEWNRAYECGNKQIDEQHRNLFKLANILLTAMMASQEKAVCHQHIEALISDISDHFTTEEQLIEAAGYPYTQEHIKIHQKLTYDALKLAKQHKTGQLEIAEVFHFLAIQVVSQHLLDEDRKFFNYFQDGRKQQ